MSQQNPMPDPAQPQPCQPQENIQPPEDKRPGERDLEIYRAVRIQLIRQKTVAMMHELTPGRVSQIVKEVSRYMARLFPGEDLKMRFSEAKRMRLLNLECHERRVEMYRKGQLAVEQSEHVLVDRQRTYDGPEEEKSLVKTVVKERGQPISVGALREMRLLNNEIQWGGGRARRDGETERRREGEKARGQSASTAGQASSGTQAEKLPPPECLSEADRAVWPKLMREEQELAAKRLDLYPQIPLDKARVPAGPLWSYYPWRTEAEHNSALLASMVVSGDYTIEKYLQELEILELSKPFAHPNLLRKDCHGQWKMMHPKQVPLPVMLPERAALPEESPERVYWPNKSKAEHFAMLRAEMVLRGHLSREQYESLNAWASWAMNEKYPDPLLQCAEKFNSSPLAGTKPGPGEAAQEAASQLTGSRFASGYGGDVLPDDVAMAERAASESLAEAAWSELPRERGRESMAENIQRPSPPPPPPTTPDPGAPRRFERLLARGRAMSPARRRRLERQASEGGGSHR